VSSLALDVFQRLLGQVQEIETVALELERTGLSQAPPILRRSAFVLAVAAIDTYFHEHAAQQLYASALASSSAADRVSRYVGRVAAADVCGSAGESFIRIGMSYKTLVAPAGIDAAMTAWGGDPTSIWRDTAFAIGTRPDRLQLQLQLFYDRRNQIAHEGDWDFVQLDFRPMRQQHLVDCASYLKQLAETMDTLI
jgi:hypothetical protein